MEKINGIIKWVTNDIKPYEGKFQMGFNLQADDKVWYNIYGPEGVLLSLKSDMIVSGNKIEFQNTQDGVTDITLISRPENQSEPAKVPAQASSTAPSKMPVKKKFEDDMVKFEDLLTEAHRKFKGLFTIKTEMLQLDLEKKFALFKATVIISNAAIVNEENAIAIYEGHGDATAENVKGLIAPHFIRMAETRSIVRALRWATNNAKCSEEEK